MYNMSGSGHVLNLTVITIVQILCIFNHSAHVEHIHSLFDY
jgi:hypothetical protein